MSALSSASVGGLGHGAHDEAAGLALGDERVDLLAQVLALGLVLDALRDADVRVLRQVDQQPPRDRDLRGKARALAADRILDHLHEQRLALGEDALDRAHSPPSPLRAVQMSATCRNAARASPISTKADCMPGSTRHTRPR